MVACECSVFDSGSTCNKIHCSTRTVRNRVFYEYGISNETYFTSITSVDCSTAYFSCVVVEEVIGNVDVL